MKLKLVPKRYPWKTLETYHCFFLEGKFLFTNGTPKRSNFNLLWLLMSPLHWCHPKDMKTFEVPVTEELLTLDKNDPNGQKRLDDYSNKIQLYLTKLFRTEASNLLVAPPKVQGMLI